MNTNNCTPKPGDRDNLKPPRFSYFRAYRSTRNALLDIQSELNRMPLQQLGAMLSRATRLARSDDLRDRATGKILSQQVLLAMDLANDPDRMQALT